MWQEIQFFCFLQFHLIANVKIAAYSIAAAFVKLESDDVV